MDNNAKFRPLYLAKILYERTDEDHYLTTMQLAQILEEEYGISRPVAFSWLPTRDCHGPFWGLAMTGRGSGGVVMTCRKSFENSTGGTAAAAPPVWGLR